MTERGGDAHRLEVLERRATILRRLCEAPAHKRDLVDETDRSRSTVNRAVSELLEVGFVEETDAGLSATVTGRLALERFADFQSVLSGLGATEAVLAPLPVDAPLSTDVVVGAEPLLATEPTPYRPVESVQEALADAARYRALLPVLDDPRHVRLLYEHVVTGGQEADLAVTPSVFESFRDEFPRQTAAMADAEGFRIRVVEDAPPFALGIFDGEDGDRSVAVVVFGDGGTVHGVLENDAATATEWAVECFESVAATGTDRTDDLLADGAGRRDGGSAALGQSLPIALEREGFVRLDAEYFREEPVADPVTAWRAGLSLAEVHTGYAVERRREAPGDGSGPRTLADDLRSDLLAGTDCVVLGPPGAGKSTLCKRVACEWYGADRGPVLYRPGGQGRPFESVEDLVATVDAAEGRALVVVEDAVRPAADRVFEALDRLGDREDVSFLLDARETEWIESDRPAAVDASLGIATVPALDEDDCRRLVDHFERTVGQAVEVPVERLWSEVREAVGDDGVTTSGMHLLLHRLSTYADPLAEGRTSLESEAAALVSDLADDEVALSVSLLANVCNAAGLGVGRDRLDAAATPGEFDAVEAALERLEGTVLFPRPDGGYRTVHESWSVAFLAELPAVLGEERAVDRFGSVVTDLLALADDPSRRDRIRSRVDRADAVAAAADDPAGWSRDVVESLSEFARDRPAVAPLFGDGETDSVALPAATPEETVREWPARLGRLFLAGGYVDRARRAFRRCPTTGPVAFERHLGLTKVDVATGEYESAVERSERCLELADGRRDRARAAREMGAATMRLDDYETAGEYYQDAIEGFEAAGDRRRVGTTLRSMGRLAMLQGEFDRARERYRESLGISRECGDRRAEAKTLNNLGETARIQGELDDAREYHEESLSIRRALGDRQGEGHSLGNLGIVAAIQGEYDRAREYFEESLGIKRKLGDRQGVANTLNNLGNVARREGEYDRAREYFEESLEVKRELRDRNGEAKTLANLGELHRVRGNYDRARECFEESRAIQADLGERRNEADALGNLGDLQRLSGDHDGAREHLERSLELAEEVGDPTTVAEGHRRLGELARVEGEYDRARDRLDRAADAAADGAEELVAGKVALSRGRLALDAGDDGVERAREHATTARETFEGIGAGPWTERSRLLLARIDAAAGEDDRARERAETALATFEDLGAADEVVSALCLLVETCRATGDGDGDALQQYRDRLEAAVEDAPDPVVDRRADAIEAALGDGPD